MKGFLVCNLTYMRQWYLFYSSKTAIGQQAVGQITKQPVAEYALRDIHTELNGLNEDSVRLSAQIALNFKGLGI